MDWDINHFGILVSRSTHLFFMDLLSNVLATSCGSYHRVHDIPAIRGELGNWPCGDVPLVDCDIFGFAGNDRVLAAGMDV